MKLEDFKVGDHVKIVRKPTFGNKSKVDHTIFSIGDVLEVKTIGEYPLGAGVTSPNSIVAARVVDGQTSDYDNNWVNIDCLEPLYEPVTPDEEDEVVRSLLRMFEVP